MKIAFEIIGYIGTALVILSMTMTSVKRLRLINVIGSVFSTAYAIFGSAWPIVLMNITLSTINLYHLTHVRHDDLLTLAPVAYTDGVVAHFTARHRRTLLCTYPDADARMKRGTEAYILYRNGEMTGILSIADAAQTLTVELLWGASTVDRHRLLYEAERICRARCRSELRLCEHPRHADRELDRLGYVPERDGYRKVL